MGGEVGDIISTLEVIVDDIDNGTGITCGTLLNTVIFVESEYNVIYSN